MQNTLNYINNTDILKNPKGSQPHAPYVLHSCETPKFYCPDNLDLPALLEAEGHRGWLPHVWKLYYVLTVIYRARWNKAQAEGAFVPLSSKVLARALGTRFYLSALRTLKKVGVIESDNHYQVGSASKGFRLVKRYHDAKFREVKGLNPMRFPRCVFGQQARDKDLAPEFQFMFTVLERVTIDAGIQTFWRQFLPKSIYQRDFYERSVEFIQQRDWTFCSDKKTGRVFTNVTNFPKSLRPYLRLDGRALGEVDVVNSQPLLLLSLYGNEPERTDFAEAVTGGTFYEMLDAQLEVPFGTARRGELKAAIFGQVLFDRVRKNPSKMCKAFAARFPVLYDRMCAIKKPDYRQLALTLQSLEAEILIGRVVAGIATGPKFPVLTIHDSILTLPEWIPDVCERLENAFVARLGAVPRLKIGAPRAENTGLVA